MSAAASSGLCGGAGTPRVKVRMTPSPKKTRTPNSALSSVSVSSAGGAKVTKEVRMLMEILRCKEVKLDSVSDKVVHSNMKRVANIISELVDNPSKISAAEVVIASNDLEKMTKAKQSKKEAKLQALNDLNAEPLFDGDTIKTFGDIPDIWLWSLLRQHVKKGIPEHTISTMSSKSNKPFRFILRLFTGYLLLYIYIYTYSIIRNTGGVRARTVAPPGGAMGS